MCLACGYEILLHHERVRCKHCGNRIPADAAVCPRCKADRSAELARGARHSRIPAFVRVGAIIVGVLLLICVGWVIFRAITTNALVRVLGLYEPTRAPTRVIQVIYVVVTPVPPTPTFSPTPSATPTPRVSPTPTRRGARTPSPAPAVTLPPGFYPAPQLLAPANTTVYNGADAVIILEWQSVAASGLRENEWYAISISYTARSGSPATQTRWSKETRWTVPKVWWNDAAPDARTFKWKVAVVRVEGVEPLASPSRTPISPDSVTRSFIWH